jgi:hypothetical protein
MDMIRNNQFSGASLRNTTGFSMSLSEAPAGARHINGQQLT